MDKEFRSKHGLRPLGAHASIAGGILKAVERAAALDATALQVFTRNQVRWESPPLAADQAAAFRLAIGESDIRFLCAHSSYLINLASPNEQTRRRSGIALLDELQRAEALGCFCLVLHPGSPKDDGVRVGIQRVASGLCRVLDETAGASVRIALENTAGQGAALGSEIEQLGKIADRVGCAERLGMCLDSAHAHAAGYDLLSPAGVDSLVQYIDRALGMNRLYLMHLNDSRSELGSHVDRHADIGRGTIGDPGFRNLLQHPELRQVPGIIETPKGDDASEADRRNLALLRDLDHR